VTIWDYLVAWPNVPFTIAVGATLLFALVQASGLAGLLGGHDDAGDADADADVDGDVDGDVDADADADADVDGDTDSDADGDDADGESWALKLGASFGMGRLPLTLLAQVFLVVFGVSGLLVNVAFVSSGAIPFWTLFYSLPVATLVALTADATMTRLLAPIVDDRLQAATKRSALVGSIATVISRQVTEEFGEVRIRDRSGHDLRLVVKLAKDEANRASLREGQEAVVVDVDERGTLLVSPLDLVMARVETDETPYEEERQAPRKARKRLKAVRAS
jgi:membrane protein implicated in regulation of membrane protease activity